MTWRDRLRPASFRGVEFKVDVKARAGGRRNVHHEFPKRDDPYAEGMGRRARRFQITAYVIGEEYHDQLDDLIGALEAEGPGLLVLPIGGEHDVVCDTYNSIERRERGGYAEIDIQFGEAGTQISPLTPIDNTQGQVDEKAKELSAATQSSVDKELLSV